MFNHYAFSAYATSAITLALVLFIGSVRKNSALVWRFGIYTLSISVWSFGYAQMVSATHAESVLFWSKALYVGAAFIPCTFFHFAAAFHPAPFAVEWLRVIRIGYGLAVIFVSLLFTHLTVVDVIPFAGSPYYTHSPGIAYPFFMLYFVIYVGLAFWAFLHEYPNASGLRKTQLKGVLVAYLVGYFGGSQTFLPVFGFGISPYSIYLVAIGVALLAFYIFTFQFLDIRVVIRKTVLYSILSGFLVTLYVTIITFAARVLEGWAGATSLYTSAIGAAVVVLLARPIQIRIQQWMDRRFPRESLGKAFFREATGSFAHEIKRPLVNISMPVQLILDDLGRLLKEDSLKKEDLAAIRDRLRFVLTQTHEASDKIEAIRALSIEDIHLTDRINLLALLESCFSSESTRLQKEKILYVQKSDLNLSEISGNEAQLKIAFSNVIRNAIDALCRIQGERRLECVVLKERQNMYVMLVDSGPGIASSDVDRLFQPWFTTKGSQGMGIGLYIAQQIIQRHGGDIVVESQLGEGTTFKMGPFK